ncbi:MAG: hypothetical protein OEP95_15115 [Myxococcales bacterium]|nr:hypothetical protein [Myxococcales bacterium]
MRRFAWLALLSLGVGLACATNGTEFALLYNPAAQHHGPERNPIIAMPGILGSKLLDRASGVVAWGAFEAGAADPGNPEGARLIALPIDGSKDFAALRDDVEPNGVLERVRISWLGVPLEIQAYAGILATLGAAGYRDEALGLAGEVDYGSDHFTCFQFDYDWRRDNVENARRLHEFILAKRAYVRREYLARHGVDVPDIKFDIVAHSMGGLIARYFLMYGSQDVGEDSPPELTWEGADLVEKLVTVGTPNAGSVEAFVQLVEGRKIGPLLPFYPPSLMGTFPSVYQLLPRERHRAVLWEGAPGEPVRVLDPSVWEAMEWGLASPKQAGVLEVLMPDVADPEERRSRAVAFQRRALARAGAFQRALDRPARAPDGLALYLVAGDADGTPARLSVRKRDGRVSVASRAPGDGTVIRSSALLDEREGGEWGPRVVTPIDFDTVLFLPQDHLGLTSNAVFRDNVLFWLLEAPLRPAP